MNEIKEIIQILFENKLYMNGNGNEFPEDSSEVDSESSTTTSEVSENGSGLGGNDQDSIGNGHNGDNSSDSEPLETQSNTSSIMDTCLCITDPDNNTCNCPHDEASVDSRIHEVNNRCHTCALPDATTTCNECFCLFHETCLPATCHLYPNSD